MKKIHHLWIALIMTLIVWGCNDDSSSPTTPPTEVEEASPQKQFIWNAMNSWYYWQGDVPELGDNYFESDQAFQEYLKNFSDAQAVFNAVQYTQEDDFSFFIDNYEEYQQSQQGISKAFGYQFGLVQPDTTSSNIFGYVQYVVPNSPSPAADAGLQRGDLFTSVDGTRLTVNNYRDLLFGRTSYELSLAKKDGEDISETGENVSLQAVTLTEDPVHVSKVLQEGSTKIGYLMYNSFQLNSHQRLNNVFNTFKTEGVDELVVDLRYNSGGAGLTSQLLGSMISGLGESSEFATYSFNEKRAANWNRTENFLDQAPLYQNGEVIDSVTVNKLSLNRVYFLVQRGTASASELLINALKPYMDVILIGQQTVGKDKGSYTLYDSGPPYLDEPADSVEVNHKIAIQPIVLKLVNSEGKDYPDGFIPDKEVDEVAYLENLPPLGDKNGPLLGKAIELITGEASAQAARLKSATRANRKLLLNSHELDPYGNQLYIQPPANINLKEKMGDK